MNVPLGDWTCPSGYRVEAWLLTSTRGGGSEIRVCWAPPTPGTIDPRDEAYYQTVIEPDLVRRLAEYQEEPVCPTLILEIDAP
jgi:hypothetical protein